MASRSNLTPILIFLFSFLLPYLLTFFLPLHHSHGVEKPVVVVLVDAVMIGNPLGFIGTPLGFRADVTSCVSRSSC